MVMISRIVGVLMMIGTLQPTLFAQVSVFDAAHVYFGGGENRRSLSSVVELPEPELSFEKIQMNLRLSCPNERCDFWDRKAGIYLVLEDGRELEIMRFMTPYRVGGQWSVDVTDLRPLLRGKAEFRVFIDTWVGPGHPQGDGWLVDLSLDFTAGVPENEAIAVLPVFEPQSVVYGLEDQPASIQQAVDLTGYDAVSGKLWTFISGHGQGNSGNCAEFCPKIHELKAGEQSFARMVWRNNCSETITDGPQFGNYWYSRAGWCPGDHVPAWTETLSFPPVPNQEEGAELNELAQAENLPENRFLEISWTPEAYINYNNDGYDNGGHTEPYYQVSALLILYKNQDAAKM